MLHHLLIWPNERAWQMMMSLRSTDSGVLPSQTIAEAIKSGWIGSPGTDIPDENIQPASLDLRLGTVAFRLRCSFLPGNEPVEEALRRYQMGRVELGIDGGGILERNRPYLIPLVEQLELPNVVRAKANPKSSTGRLDIFTRVITDRSFMFDEVPPGYKGRLYLEVVPRTFTIRVTPGLTLNQLRLMVGHTSLSDDDIRKLHSNTPLLFRKGLALGSEEVTVSSGLFMGLDLGRDAGGEVVGYSAKENSSLIDLSKVGQYSIHSFWERVISEGSKHGARIILQPEKFYLLLSQDSVRIPPEYAAEMTAYDPTSGELRTHYAGFFDPGFGYDDEVQTYAGSRAALEVRAHDVPFAVEHGQNICKLSFDKMLEPPDRLYGYTLSSNYQGQEMALSKHFKREHHGGPPQASLFY
jgi:dCTP deaminase